MVSKAFVLLMLATFKALQLLEAERMTLFYLNGWHWFDQIAIDKSGVPFHVIRK
jgi:hypothetical protein